MKTYDYSEVDSFIEDVTDISDYRERWETNINLSCSYYDFTISVLYITDIIEDQNKNLIIRTYNNNELKFLILENTEMKITKARE